MPFMQICVYDCSNDLVASNTSHLQKNSNTEFARCMLPSNTYIIMY